MDVKAFYAAIGGSYETALGRLMKDSLIERFVTKFLNDPSFSQLEAALKDGNMDEAYTAAHTLKGVTLNLAFAELGRSATALSDSLLPRLGDARDLAQIMPLYEKVKGLYQTVIEKIGQFS